MSDPRSTSIRRLNGGFQVLLGLAMGWLAYCLLDGLFGADFRVGFLTIRGPQIVTGADLSWPQRLVVVAIAAAPDICWVLGLIQLLQMSFRFRRGEIFSEGVIRRLQGFGWALVLMAVAEASVIPAMVGYLVWLKKIDSLENTWEYVLGGGALNSLLAAVLVVIIAKIMRIAMQADEDVRLTI